MTPRGKWWLSLLLSFFLLTPVLVPAFLAMGCFAGAGMGGSDAICGFMFVLALLLGIGLPILIGILIGNHLIKKSKQTKQRSDLEKIASKFD